MSLILKLLRIYSLMQILKCEVKMNQLLKFLAAIMWLFVFSIVMLSGREYKILDSKYCIAPGHHKRVRTIIPMPVK